MTNFHSETDAEQNSAASLSKTYARAPTHLEKQTDQTRGRLARVEAQLTETNAALSAMMPPIKEHLAKLTQDFRVLCEQRQAQLLKQAFEDSAWKCLNLSPLKARTPEGSSGAFGLAWLMVVMSAAATVYLLQFLGYWSLLPAVIAAAYLYSRCLRKARHAWAGRESGKANAQIAGLAQYQVVAMHIAEDPSGNRDYPYSCVEVGNAAEYRDHARNFDPKTFGALYGITLIGFIVPGQPRDLGLWMTLPEEGDRARFIDISGQPQLMANFSEIAEALLTLASSNAREIAVPMKALEAEVKRRRAGVTECNRLKARLESLATQEAAWRNVAVNREALDKILVQLELFKLGGAGAPKGMLLYGPPGTGKTSIALNMAAASGCNFMNVTMADLKGEFQGKTAPKVLSVWERARAKGPCIMFLDECEGMLGTRGEAVGGHNVNFNNELMETFLPQWDGENSSAGQVFVVGATNRPDNLDKAVDSRFNARIEIGLPDLPSRKQILALEFRKRDIPMLVSEKMAKDTSGMSGRDLFNLANTFRGEVLTEEPSEDLFTASLKQARAKNSTLTDGVTWDQVVLPDETKTRLKGLSRKIKRAEEYLKAGFEVPKSLLLYGPPGTGKTEIARAMATESGIAFLAFTTGDVKGVYSGESGKQVKRMFESARAQAPCLIFLDEIDLITGTRGQSDRGSQEIVGQLLQEMDGIKSRAGTGFVFVLAATNCRESIDPAVLSRFGDKEEIALPGTEARSAILEVLLNGKPLGFELGPVAARLAMVTEGFSGRDLATMVNAAASNAMHRADVDGVEIEGIRILESDFTQRIVHKPSLQVA